MCVEGRETYLPSFVLKFKSKYSNNISTLGYKWGPERNSQEGQILPQLSLLPPAASFCSSSLPFLPFFPAASFLTHSTANHLLSSLPPLQSLPCCLALEAVVCPPDYLPDLPYTGASLWSLYVWGCQSTL